MEQRAGPSIAAAGQRTTRSHDLLHDHSNQALDVRIRAESECFLRVFGEEPALSGVEGVEILIPKVLNSRDGVPHFLLLLRELGIHNQEESFSTIVQSLGQHRIEENWRVLCQYCRVALNQILSVLETLRPPDEVRARASRISIRKV